MEFGLDKFVIENKSISESINNLLSTVSNKLTSYDIDKHINKRGLFNKKKYLSIFDAYVEYYRISMDIEPMVAQIKQSQDMLKENSIFLESYSEERLNQMLALKVDREELTNNLLNFLEKYKEDDIDYSINKSNLEAKLYNIDLQLKMLEQEQMSIILIKKTNLILENTMDELINYGIPQWKKQIKLSIDLMSDYNKNQMNLEKNKQNNGIIIDNKVQKEIDNIKKSKEYIKH